MYHYKERKPKETIEIITNFFKLKNLEVQEIRNIKSELNTFSCTYALFLNNKLILRTNGKGITLELAQASGLAELYERFCYYNFRTSLHPIVYSDIIKKQQNIIQLNINEFIQDEHIYAFLDRILPEMSQEYIKAYIKFYLNNNLYGNIFYCLNDISNIKYKNIQTLTYITGTNGLATGNTIEEALVQGCCELYEREIIEAFYHNQIEQFYQINFNYLKGTQFEKWILFLNNKNIIVNIYDCSYIFNTPVVMLVAFDLKTKWFYYQFGAHPVFNIALERCFTELYQGIFSLEDAKAYQGVTQYRDSLWADIAITSMQGPDHTYGFINNNLIINSKIIDNYNASIFLSDINNNNDDISNINLLNYINILNEKNNVTFYYSNLSLNADIFTVYIIQDKLTQKASIESFKKYSKKYDKQTWDLIFKSLNIFFDSYNFLLTQNSKISDTFLSLKIQQIFNLLQQVKILSFDEIINIFLDFTIFNKFYSNFILAFQKTIKIGIKDQFFMILDILYEKNFSKNYMIPEHHLYEIYKLIESYYIQEYPKEKIRKILDWLHYENIELNFELKDMTPIWYINKIFIEPLYARYHSQEYYDFINIFGPDETMKELKD